MAGQINRGTFFGDQVYNLSLNKNFKNYVEVGTWNGEGSTKCFVDALLQRNDESALYSLEANIEFYEQARRYWDPLMATSRSLAPKLHLLYGRIIEAEELVTAEEVQGHPRFPPEIDVILLDGGQFSTRSEFNKLKDRTKIVLLDDTLSFKTDKVREDILKDPDSWTVIFDNIADRHGWFMACKTQFVDLLESQ